MAKITVPTDTVELQVGDKTIEAALLDVYYLMVNSTEQISEAPSRQKMEAMAAALNAEYDCSITWGQATQLLSSLDKEVTNLKKNTTQEQE